MAQINSNEYEICISCGQTTDILRSTHISQREHYIEGCGQMCRTCAWKINKEENDKKNSRGV